MDKTTHKGCEKSGLVRNGRQHGLDELCVPREPQVGCDGPADGAVGHEQVGHPAWDAQEAQAADGSEDGLVLIGDDGEWEVVARGESVVALAALRAEADDADAGAGEFVGVFGDGVAHHAGLAGADGCPVGGVGVEEDRPIGYEVAQGGRLVAEARGGRYGDIGDGRAFGQHGAG